MTAVERAVAFIEVGIINKQQAGTCVRGATAGIPTIGAQAMRPRVVRLEREALGEAALHGRRQALIVGREARVEVIERPNILASRRIQLREQTPSEVIRRGCTGAGAGRGESELTWVAGAGYILHGITRVQAP